VKVWSVWVVCILLLQREARKRSPPMRLCPSALPPRPHSHRIYSTSHPRPSLPPVSPIPPLSPILAIPPCAYGTSSPQASTLQRQTLARALRRGSELYYRAYIRACGHRSQVGDHHHRFRSCQSSLSRCLPATGVIPVTFNFSRNDVVVSV